MKNIIKSNFRLIKYVLVAGMCFLTDQLLFNLILLILKHNSFILLAKFLARSISSFINYMLNSKVVFNKKSKNSIIKYYALVIIQACMSGISIYILKIIFDDIPVVFLSVFVDVIIFVVNYFVQKKWVF